MGVGAAGEAEGAALQGGERLAAALRVGRQVERTCRRLLGEQAGRKDRGGQSAHERRQSKEPDGKQ